MKYRRFVFVVTLLAACNSLPVFPIDGDEDAGIDGGTDGEADAADDG